MAVYLARMFGISLAVTMVTELMVVLLYRFFSLGRNRGKKEPDLVKSWGHKGNLALLVVLVNLLTNPMAVCLCWLGRVYLPPVVSFPVQILVEMAVMAVEAKVYLDFSKKPGWQIASPVRMAVTANLCSWLLGLVVNRYLGLLDLLGFVLENLAG